MSVRKFINSHIGDIDVYDDYDERLGVCFCGGDVKLTADGELRFADALNLSIYVYDNDNCALVDVKDSERLVDEASDLFYTLAGYCSVEDYERYVEEV